MPAATTGRPWNWDFVVTTSTVAPGTGLPSGERTYPRITAGFLNVNRTTGFSPPFSVTGRRASRMTGADPRNTTEFSPPLSGTGWLGSPVTRADPAGSRSGAEATTSYRPG